MPGLDQRGGQEPPGSPRHARLEAVRGRAVVARARLEQERPAHESVEIGFRWLLRDKEIAGGVLGGGLAYRFFFWVLSLSVVAAGGVGFLSRANAGRVAAETGASESLAQTVATAAQQSGTSRWWLLLTGITLLLWFSLGLLRALRLVHAAAWRIPLPPFRKAPMAMATVVATPFAFLLLAAAAGWVRVNVGFLPGLVATLAVLVVFAALWLRASIWLPSPDVPWTAFLPGAVVFGLGVEALHLFSVYFLEAKLSDASQLYGALGLATTALFYLFLLGRGVVWAAELNAVVWEVRSSRDSQGSM